MSSLAPGLRSDVKVIGLVGVAHGLSHFYQLVIAVMFPLIKEDLGVSYAALGAATALFYTVSGICQTIAGFAVDRFGARRVLLGGLALCSAGVLLAGLAHSYPALVIASIVAGIGNSVFHPADFAILNARVDTRRLGYAFSFHGIGGTLGWALAPVFSFSLSALWGWHVTLVIASLLGVAMIVLIALDGGALEAIQQRAVAATPGAGLRADVRVLFATPVLLCFGYFLLLAGALIGVQNFGVSAMVAYYGTPVAVASTALTAFLIGTATGILAGGWAAGRTQRHDLVATGGMMTAGLLMLVVASGVLSAWMLAPLLAFAGFATGLTNPSRDLLVRGATPPGSSGKVYGFVYSGLDLGSMLTPVAFGWLLDRHLAAGVFYGVCAMLLLTIVTVFQLAARRPATL
ncbi:MAG: MFS transporter [Proteobacteria bacterium]|nr:MFS transporter [Pseudomonadota bacterium]